jgi:hypothetical protein
LGIAGFTICYGSKWVFINFAFKQWGEFEVLAMHAQTLSSNFKEDENVLQVCAIEGNQIIRFNGAVPGFSIIFKAWLSRQLNITESNIVEGFWDNPEK